MSCIWKEIEGYEGLYEISSNGDIRNMSGLSIKQRPMRSRGGYMYVNLCNKGVEKTYRVHRLVAKAFVPNPESKSEVNHIDFNRVNNKAENLEWVSSYENKRHSIENYSRGMDHFRSVVVLHSLIGVFVNLNEAANMWGVSPQYMCDMLIGRAKNKTPFLYV